MEKIILGLYLTNPSLMESFSQPYLNLMFYADANKKLHSAMMDLGPKTDPMNVHNYLRREGLNEAVGGEDYIGEILRETQNGHRPDLLPQYIGTLEEKYLARQIIQFSTGVLRDVYGNTTLGKDNKTIPIKSLSEYIRQFSIDVLKLLPWRFRKKYDIKEAVEETMQEFDELVKRKGKPKISTGYKGLDRIMHGILPHRLTLVGARPKVGKTSFSLNLIDNVSEQGYSSAMFSMECSRSELIQKLICMHSGVDSERFVYWDKDSIPNEEIENISKAADYIQNMPIHIDDSKPDIDYILSRSTQLKTANPDLALIVVDGLQAFQGYIAYQGNKSDIYYEILKKLKGLAVDLSVNVVLNCQLKATTVEKRKDKRPRDLDDFSDCKGIPEVADNAFALYRPEFYWPENDVYKNWTSVIPMVMRIGDKKERCFRMSSDMRTSKFSEYVERK